MVMLSEAGIQSYGVKRGLDHGVWSGFHVGRRASEVSLYKNEDPHAHYALGRAVASLREQGIVIIGAGMSVHNLRDMHYMYEGNNKPMPYTVSFDNALKEAVEVDPALREDKMAAVTKRGDAHQAHPFMDHLMPVYIAAGAAGEDWGKQTWTLHEGSFGWAQYRFGDVPEVSSAPKL
ncbi:4,5-DOPA dioxygenase extradiol-like protein [Ilyonectria robusta]